MYRTKIIKTDEGKECSKCRVFKSWDKFQKDKNTKDGHTSLCKECRNKNSAKWREANPEKNKELVNRWVQDNKEYLRAEARKYAAEKREVLGKEGWSKVVDTWNKENPEKLQLQRKKHYAANKKRLRDKQALDRARRPEAYRAYDAEKRAKRKNGHCAWANKEAIQAIYDYAKYITELTGIEHHVDHIVPLVNPMVQGLHVEHNLRVVTAAENLEKGNRLLE